MVLDPYIIPLTKLPLIKLYSNVIAETIKLLEEENTAENIIDIGFDNYFFGGGRGIWYQKHQQQKQKIKKKVDKNKHGITKNILHSKRLYQQN